MAGAPEVPRISEPSGRPPNILVILADEHAASALGCYGHPVVQTPHLDRIGTQGTVFDRAYCNVPICVPSRLSFFSGRYAHQVGGWDNGSAPPRGYRTWGHYLGASGYETVLAGRTHINGSDRLVGFERRLSDDLPKWRHEGQAAKRDSEWRRGNRSHVTECGAGTNEYAAHDVDVTDRCVSFLREKASAAARGAGDEPWILYCGYMLPHFPLIAPPEYLALYSPDAVPLPQTWDEPPAQQHPVIRHLRWAFHNDEPLPEAIQRLATASYWALITYLDHQIGRLLDAIDGSLLRENTVIIYTSDHGEMGGEHGMWQKMCFYEPSVRVPLIMRLPPRLEPDLPALVAENVSLVDVLPTLLALGGAQAQAHAQEDLPGSSLLEIARQADTSIDPRRAVFSEYHAQGTEAASYMLKQGDLKYCYYVGHEPQLFDVANDPAETRNLATAPEHGETLKAMSRLLREIADPEEVDAAAKARLVYWSTA